jgi:hypothetical protein
MWENPVMIAVSIWSTVFSIVFSVGVFCVIVAIAYSNHRHSKRRKKHKSTHVCMSDADFLAKLNVEAKHHDLCLDIRKALAQAVKVPTETLHPSDSDAHLAKLGFTLEDLLLTLGAIGSYDIDYNAVYKLAYGDKSSVLSSYGNTLADLIRFILDHLEISKTAAK